MNNIKERFQDQVGKKWLTTEIKPWVRIASAIFYSIICIGSVVAYLLILEYVPETESNLLHSVLFLIFVWLFCELVLIRYLYKSYDIPKYVRDVVGMVIIFGNLWFLFAVVGFFKT